MSHALNALWVSLLALLAAGSLLPLSGSDHWFVRGWDFPRVQIVVLGWLLALGSVLTLWRGKSTHRGPLWASFALALFLSGWHGYRIFPYTPLASQQAESTEPKPDGGRTDGTGELRVVISNVEMENDQYDRWMEVMRSADPDLLIVLEPDRKWAEAIEPLTSSYPERISVPLDNWYGMVMLSKLPVVEHEVRFLVQEDVPSIDAELRLSDNQIIRVISVHPRPPEPLRGNDATARDAELTLWGKELAGETRPTIIAGDLNDVAWSSTTRLFLRTSEMLDPRRGRGMFNTFHAERFWMRFPLDHVFFSPHFTVSEIQLLPHVGSDHFPILIDLRHSPAERDEQRVLSERAGDREQMNENIERAIEDPQIEGEAVEESDPDKTKAMSL